MANASIELDPYQASIDAVWHDPTSYDANFHAPPYMPGGEQLIQGKRASAQEDLPKAVHEAVFSDEKGPLPGLLALLQAASLLHKTHHWQVAGPYQYGDHLLFDRLYNDGLPFVDQVAERAVGSGGSEWVDPHVQSLNMATIIDSTKAVSTDYVSASLTLEKWVLRWVDEARDWLKQANQLTNGTDNLLQGVADLHETFVYLLQQRQVESPIYDYDR